MAWPGAFRWVSLGGPKPDLDYRSLGFLGCSRYGLLVAFVRSVQLVQGVVVFVFPCLGLVLGSGGCPGSLLLFLFSLGWVWWLGSFVAWALPDGFTGMVGGSMV